MQLTKQIIVFSKTVKDNLALCSKYDDNVKNRIKYYKNFFHKEYKSLPCMRNTRRLLSKCRLLLAFKKCQMNPDVKDYRAQLLMYTISDIE
jgi:hypothetical protein